MFTAFKNWLETRSLRSDVGIAKRDRRAMRRLGRDIAKDAQTGERIDDGFQKSGQKEKILQAFKRYHWLMSDEVKNLRVYIVGYKVLIRRAIENLEHLEQDIKANAHEQHKQELLAAVAKMEAEILHSFKNFFASITSFENTTFSTAKLLDKSSQARDLYYQALQLRKPARSLAKLIASEDHVERKGAGRDLNAEKARYDLIASMLHTEIEQQARGLNNAFLLLQEIQADIGTKFQLIDSEVTKDHYPAAWAQENREEIAPLREEIDGFIKNETEQGRIFLSQVERAQG